MKAERMKSEEETEREVAMKKTMSIHEDIMCIVMTKMIDLWRNNMLIWKPMKTVWY